VLSSLRLLNGRLLSGKGVLLIVAQGIDLADITLVSERPSSFDGACRGGVGVPATSSVASRNAPWPDASSPLGQQDNCELGRTAAGLSSTSPRSPLTIRSPASRPTERPRRSLFHIPKPWRRRASRAASGCAEQRLGQSRPRCFAARSPAFRPRRRSSRTTMPRSSRRSSVHPVGISTDRRSW